MLHTHTGIHLLQKIQRMVSNLITKSNIDSRDMLTSSYKSQDTLVSDPLARLYIHYTKTRTLHCEAIKKREGDRLH